MPVTQIGVLILDNGRGGTILAPAATVCWRSLSANAARMTAEMHNFP
jgi:hypothetical protein